jgi:hypothetical protein
LLYFKQFGHKRTKYFGRQEKERQAMFCFKKKKANKENSAFLKEVFLQTVCLFSSQPFATAIPLNRFKASQNSVKTNRKVFQKQIL